ncbi:hypothetical protein BJ508DRAFT_38634 [Ascobolus immersus RN42]|uniref:Vacuolar protein sorting-associated protein 51 homolog n=1 Tax=Ascobolus immersus RN42 TaxID=1160509 RepID=A0A3N4ISA2_ASCIM|nr:hypothetical protein BJ508DRAFT_38634 [Ascobolus immersus RN42]
MASLTSNPTSPTPSTRPSIDSRSATPVNPPITNSTEAAAAAASAAPRAERRNRNALRQFYGLAGTQAQGISELEKEGFDAKKWVENLCKEKDLAGLLKAENELINEIRGLDGERKALVYDNYSKLIVATETIRQMRTNMTPLSSTTSGLEPAIAHIANVSASLASSLPSTDSTDSKPVPASTPEEREAKLKKQKTVKWALAAPARIQSLLDAGKTEEAEQDKKEVLGLLEKWGGVKGVDELRTKVEALGRHDEEEKKE